MGKTRFTPDRYRFSDGRGYCEVYQEISQILIKYPVTTGISEATAVGPTLRSKSTGRCNKCPAPFGTWNLEPPGSSPRVPCPTLPPNPDYATGGGGGGGSSSIVVVVVVA